MNKHLLNQLKYLDETISPLLNSVTKRCQDLAWEIAELQNDVSSKISCLDFEIDLNEESNSKEGGHK